MKIVDDYDKQVNVLGKSFGAQVPQYIEWLALGQACSLHPGLCGSSLTGGAYHQAATPIAEGAYLLPSGLTTTSTPRWAFLSHHRRVLGWGTNQGEELGVLVIKFPVRCPIYAESGSA